MDLRSTAHIYEITPPYLNNRDLPAIMLKKVIAEMKTAQPEATDEEIWRLATEKVQAENDMIWFGVQAVSMPEADKLDREIANLYNDFTRDKVIELEAGKRLQQIKGKILSINNMALDGEKVTTFDDFYARAPRELVQWLLGAVHSTITLSLSERKNFLPE